METPVTHILIAWEGQVDYISKTNPFGRAKKQDANPQLQEQRNLFHRMKMDARERIREKKV